MKSLTIFENWKLSKIQQNIKITFRCFEEGELMRILYQIMEGVKTADENMIISYTEKFDLLHAQQLKKKSQRRTITHMLKILPQILQGLKLLQKLVTLIFNQLQTFNQVHNPQKLMKFLRMALKYIQNLIQYLNKNNNYWTRSQATTTAFLNYVILNEDLLNNL